MLDLIKGGTAYSLDDGTYCYFLSDDGWGMAPLHRLVERGPLQHGETDRGFRLDPRIGVIVLGIEADDTDDFYAARDTLLGLFGPINDPLSLRWTLPSRTRQIDCFYQGDMKMGSTDRTGYSLQKIAIQLKCPDPTFYNPAAESEAFALGGGSDALVVPLTVPLVVGASTLDSTTVINYDGNWRTYPHLIRITGPITDAKITNEATGEILHFDGVTIAAGDYYDIDLRFGHKTIEDSSGNNKIADLSDDSDLATWRLLADPEAPGGINTIRVTGVSATEATQVEMTYYTRFLGI